MHAFSSPRRIIEELSRSHGFAVRFGEYRLRQQWEAIVGASVASHTWPTRIRFRTLHVAVEHSVWLHQLTYLKATLLENIQSAMPDLDVRDIQFRLGDRSESSECSASETAPAIVEEVAAIQVSPEARRIAAKCAHVIQDEALRDSLTRVLALALSSGPRTTNP